MMDNSFNSRDLNQNNNNGSNSKSKLNQPNQDQFKATKLWNELLHAFYLGVELKKHRRQMKVHYDCFTTSEAISWLKDHLQNNENFNRNKVTRFQALNLLRKYHKSNIIERVNIEKNDQELKDNNSLFRFTGDANENLPYLMLTSKSEVDLLNSCSRQLDDDDDNKPMELDVREKIDIHKVVIRKHLTRSLYNINDYLKLEQINGQTLLNNVTRVNSNGVVQLTDKSEDLPHWIMSAMKCLANWPNASGSGNCLPKYPGFESDVFKLIREYFTNMEDPIIPYNLYRLFIDVYDLYLQFISRQQKQQQTMTKSWKKLTETVSPVINHYELGLPANCVYETVFSTKDPVTKIVPIDELSTVFPSFVEYFKRQQNSRFNAAHTSNTFRALSTIPRSSTKKRFATPQPESSISNMMHNSPPEICEYKNADHNNVDSSSFRRYYSLRKNSTRQNLNTNNNSFNNSQTELLPHTENQYYRLIQLLLLLLPNSNRRYLQLLIRLFYKIVRNKELCLLGPLDSLALKEYIVSTFTRCIIRSEQEKDFNEQKSKEFCTFLIDECMDIFQVPKDFLDETQKMMNDLKEEKNQQTKKPANGNNVPKSHNDYCKKISNEQYELERDALSDKALSDLLQSIMFDDALSERDKLKWIKQFKMYHPDVYDVYVSNNNQNIFEDFINNNNNNSSNQENRQHRKNRQKTFSLINTIGAFNGSNSSSGDSIKGKRVLFKRFLSLKI